MWINQEAIKVFEEDLGPEQGHSLCVSFCSLLCARIRETIGYLDAQNIRQLERVCHNIKNNANYIGATDLVRLAKRFETHCKESKTALIAAETPEFKNCLQSTLSELQRFIEVHGHTSQ